MVTYSYTPITGGTYPGGYYLNTSATSPNGQVMRNLQEVIVPKTVDQFTTTAVTNPFTTVRSTSSVTTGFVTTVSQPSPFWGYGFIMGGSPSNQPAGSWCGSVTPSPTSPLTLFGGSGLISVPTWITGDVCITGGANPAIGNPASGPTIPVHIGGSLAVNGPNYAVGTPSSLVRSADITACWSDFHGWHNVACSSTTQNANNGGSGVYAVPPYTAGASGVTPPSLSTSQINSGGARPSSARTTRPAPKAARCPPGSSAPAPVPGRT